MATTTGIQAQADAADYQRHIDNEVKRLSILRDPNANLDVRAQNLQGLESFLKQKKGETPADVAKRAQDLNDALAKAKQDPLPANPAAALKDTILKPISRMPRLVPA